MIVIPLPLPPEQLHSNGRTRSHGWRASLVRKARGEAKLVAGQYRPRVPYEAVTIQPTFYLHRKRDGDGLNAWLKPYLDGIADAKIVANDSGVTLLPPIQVTGKKQSPRVVLTITERKDEA